jgi:hypothetical protein
MKCVLTWKAKATKCNRLLFQLAPSTPRTAGIGSGLLLTPKATEAEEDRERFVERNGDRSMDCYPNLMTQIAMMPFLKTPSTVETEGGVMEIRPGCDGHYKLRDQIAMLPTPRQFCYKDAKEDRNKSNLGEIVGTSRGLKLQPAFVEWMMGYPEGWTELTDSRHSGIRSSPPSRSRSLKASQISKGK